MRIGICGGLGGGKTLLMTIFGKDDYLSGQKVYSNYKTSFSEMISPLDLMEQNQQLKNCSLCLDELYTWVDSRLSGTKGNRLITYFALQTRKIDVNLYYTAQLSGSVDLRLQFITDIIILAERRKNGFAYTVYYDYIPKGTFFLPEVNAEMFYDDYDTTEVILPLELDRDIIDFNIILEFFNVSETKVSFSVLTRSKYPFMTLDTSKALYDLLKAGHIEYAQKLVT